jgi:hypothetical protein
VKEDDGEKRRGEERGEDEVPWIKDEKATR